jgi:DNA ligase-associated metallophosphoesterase
LLSTERCIFWEEEKILLLSDLHFGKTGHFRKEGIAVPQDVYKEDLQRLVAQIQFYKPTQLIIIGDMFHSHANRELDFFKKWRNDFTQLPIQLIRGNHDILQNDWYNDAGIDVVETSHSVGPFSFTHDIAELKKEDTLQTYFFSGHIHPGISISGAGRQSLRFPCFYFAGQYAVLPAFSKFTGCHPIRPKRGDNVFAVLPSGSANNEAGSIIKL